MMKIRMGWAAMVLVAVGCGRAWASEPDCYRTEDAAAMQTGVRGVEGFRLEGTRRDVFSGAVWATVRSCQHPERPAVLVLASRGSTGKSSAGLVTEAPAAKALVMLAGSRIRLVIRDAMARMEVSAIAQTSAALGERVRVRLLPVSADGGPDGVASWGSPERYAVGVVKSGNLVEAVSQ